MLNSCLAKVLIVTTIFLGSHAYGQFTYFELGFNNTNVIYQGGYKSELNTSYHAFSLRVNAISRFLRNFGIGVELNVPLAQGNKFSFTGASTLDGSYYNEDDFKIGDYKPQKYDYTFKHSISGTLLGRIYLSTRGNFYFDVRGSYLAINEFFEFKRAAFTEYDNTFPTMIPAENRTYEWKHNLFVPGFAIGIQPHVSKKLFVNFNGGVDFYTFDKIGFKYDVIYGFEQYINGAEIVRLESKATDTKVGIFFNLGMGYFF